MDINEHLVQDLNSATKVFLMEIEKIGPILQHYTGKFLFQANPELAILSFINNSQVIDFRFHVFARVGTKMLVNI